MVPILSSRFALTGAGTVRTPTGGLPQVPTQELVDHSRDGRTGWAMAQQDPRIKAHRASLHYVERTIIGLDTPIAKGRYSEP